MKKRMLKLLAMLMALALLCGVMPFTASAADWPPADAVPLALDDVTWSDIPAWGETRYFVFTPSETSWYSFEFGLNPSSYCSGYLYDADGNPLAADESNVASKRIRSYLTAGATYYLMVRYTYLYEASVSMSVRLKIWPPPAYFSYTPSETASYIFAHDASINIITCYRADGQIYNLAGTHLRSDNHTRVIYYDLEAGETYYFNVNPEYGAGRIQTAEAYLNELLAQAKAISRLWLPTSVWKALQTAIANAEAVLNNPEATQNQIKTAIWALIEALNDMTPYNFAAGQGFNYRPGYIITLLTKYGLGDYGLIILLSYISQVPL